MDDDLLKMLEKIGIKKKKDDCEKCSDDLLGDLLGGDKK